MCKVTVAVSTTGESLLGRGGRGRPNRKVQSSHGRPTGLAVAVTLAIAAGHNKGRWMRRKFKEK